MSYRKKVFSSTPNFNNNLFGQIFVNSDTLNDRVNKNIFIKYKYKVFFICIIIIIIINVVVKIFLNNLRYYITFG